MTFSSEQVARLFERLAAGSAFKSRAYREGARAIRGLSEPLEAVVKGGRELKETPGIGKAIAAKVEELFRTGTVRVYEDLRAQLPSYALSLLEAPGVGPRTAGRIISETKARTLEELLAALEGGHVSWLPRSGERSPASIARALRRTADAAAAPGVGAAGVRP